MMSKEKASSLHRQWLTLQRLPQGKWLGTADIQQMLEREGVQVSLRTIQRDLNQLAERFPLESNGASPQGWRWRADAQISSLPHISTSQAVTFLMVEEHLRHLLPPSLLDELRPWFDMAQRAVNHSDNQGRHWLDCVRIIPPTQPLIPPTVKREAQQAIYEALLTNKQLIVSYQRRYDKISAEYTLNPLAIVQRGPVIYLVCTRTDSPKIRLFALQRFMSAELLKTVSIIPDDFNVDDYLATGALGFGSGDTIRLKALFTKAVGDHLYESKLSEDQVISETADDRLLVEATVKNTQQLLWWLRGFGDAVEVLEPSLTP
ncbi:WYL domain-containing protein [Moraxellaceae bacterium AER2_44_116]|nr:WYL domain-containing protein [Moraxellaceae bacterium]TQC99394.1 WYL domain-containing protein [Moraxellaceae bacterium AER2_44_116]